LDVKTDATELGIKNIVEDQNLNIISGEIELIQSKLFLNRVLDSLNLDVSYFSSGEVLNYEMFGNVPFIITYRINNGAFYNTPFYFRENPDGYTLRIGTTGHEVNGTYGEVLKLEGLELVLSRNPNFVDNNENEYFFVLNSRDVLLNYLLSSLAVEPLNFNANTIRITFIDNNPFKAHAIVNKIDSMYLDYSNEQKNLANKQKIDWLVNELHQIETKMEDFEDYFENFTLQNKTNDLDADLKKTVDMMNRIDSQRFDLTRRVRDLEKLTEQLSNGIFYVSASQRQFLPEFINNNLDQLQKVIQEQDKLKLSYSESTFAFREKQNAIENARTKVAEQLKEEKTS
jgi:uncharacterized protein involved in exopolysaccharide biosynthesis